MMGLDPHRLRFLRQAKAFGIGNYDARMIEIIGEMLVLENFKVPQLGGEAIVSNPTLQNLLDAKTRVTPAANPETCTGCGSCVEHCPVSALTMVQELPVVNPELCIACFCCQEICPEKAMGLT